MFDKCYPIGNTIFLTLGMKKYVDSHEINNHRG